MSENDKFDYKDLRDVLHAIRDERVIVCGVIQRLKESDTSLKRIEERIHNIILKQDGY